MFDLAWSELLVIAIVAIVVVGPKDLPKMMRVLGKWGRQARSLANEFRVNIEQMSQNEDIKTIRSEVEEMGRNILPPSLEGRDALSSLMPEDKVMPENKVVAKNKTKMANHTSSAPSSSPPAKAKAKNPAPAPDTKIQPSPQSSPAKSQSSPAKR